MFKRTKVCTGLMLAFGSTLALGVSPAFAQQQLERVEVTGSRIKRVETETAAPVQIISRKEIERTGAQTVNEVLQQITGAGSALDDRFTNGFAPGGGALNLRGLGFNSTLVLVNGRRLPTYPFAQQVTNGTQGFNDLQNIPLAAVDRIEVLKDGASAVYGADAVAGVVNVILRQDYRGLEAGVTLGESAHSDGKTRAASLTAGFGTLTSDRYNFLVGANLSKRDEIPSRARAFAGTEDLRDAGGVDRRSSFGYPGTITDLTTGAVFFDAGGTCGPSTQHGGSSIRGAFCRYDRPTLGSLQPASEKTGIYTKLSFGVTPDITAFAEVLFSRNKFSANSWPAGTTDDVGIGSNILPAGSPSNPFPNDAEIRYRFADVGNRGDKGTTDTTHAVLGVKGMTASWEWEAALNLNRIKIDDTPKNNVLNSHTMCLTNPSAAASYSAGGDPLGLGTIDQIFAANPVYATYFKNELGKCAAAFATYGYYNYINPSANTPGTADFLRHDSTRTGRSTLNGFDVKASRDLMPLGGGQLAMVIGFETRKEKVSDIPDLELQTGDTLSISAAQAFGSRTVSAAFAELSAPFTKTLEGDFALRHDKYTGNGSFASTSPKFGLRYQPSKSLLLRATASKAFRAPSLFETTPAQQTSFVFGIQDPVRCPDFSQAATNPDCALDIRQVQTGNPALKPEKSKAYTLGMVLEPANAVTVSVDLWKITRKDEIGLFDPQLLVNLFANNPNIVVRNPAGQITQLNLVPVQLNKTSTWGTDVELNVRNDLGEVGRLTSRIGMTYVGSYRFSTLDANGAPALAQYNGTYNYPRWRRSWDFALARGSWEYSLAGYAVAGYEGLGNTTFVAPFDIWNAGISYTGVKNLTIRFQIVNMFNRHPSFDDETSGSNAGYNPQFGDPVGRFYSVGVNYKFF
jgi:iron complex outermembrane receptor protein